MGSALFSSVLILVHAADSTEELEPSHEGPSSNTRSRYMATSSTLPTTIDLTESDVENRRSPSPNDYLLVGPLTPPRPTEPADSNLTGASEPDPALENPYSATRFIYY